MSKKDQFEQTVRGLSSFLERRWERKAKAQHTSISRVREYNVYPWEQESDKIKTINDERDYDEHKST